MNGMLDQEKRQPVLTVHGLHKYYKVGSPFSKRFVHAVDGVDFSIYSGETLALVGESGSGKSTAGRTTLRLEEPTSGQVILEGTSVTEASPHELRRLRARMQIVFQDPLESLNPRMRIEEQVAEPLWLSGIMSRKDAHIRARELLSMMHLPTDAHLRFPHQLSGGQLQRISIARAIGTNPALVVLDEPTSALDVSVQAQIINLLQDLQQRLALAFLFITHDLNLVGYMSHRVAVMYMGQIVELGETDLVQARPGHPYTRALMSAAPADHPRERRKRIILPGEPLSPVNPTPGCRLASRCPFVQPECLHENIELREVLPGHWVRCRRFALEHQNGEWHPESRTPLDD